MSSVSRTIAGIVVEAGRLGGAPAALPHDQLVGVRAGAAAPRRAGAARPRGSRSTSSAIASSSKTWRGCRWLGLICSIGSSANQAPATTAGPLLGGRRLRARSAGPLPSPPPSIPGCRRSSGVGSGGAVGISAPSPRPRPRRRPVVSFMPGAPLVDDLAGGLEIAQRARASPGRRSSRSGRRTAPRTPAPSAGSSVRSTWSPKCSRTSSATPAASRVRASYIVTRMVRDRQPRVEVLADHLHGLQQLPEALQRVVLRLDRDQHLRPGHQGVQRQQPQRGRAVDEDVVVALLPRGLGRADARVGLERPEQPALPGHDADQLDLGARQVDGGRHHPEIRRPRGSEPPRPPAGRRRRAGRTSRARRAGAPRSAPSRRCPAGPGR